MILNFFRGFSMGIANSVPGVSGGTIAFILGFYDKFINSLHNVVAKDKKVRKEAILYLINIGVGLVTSLLLCILILTKLFESQVYLLCSIFIGLTVAAIPYVVLQEKSTLKGKYYHCFWALLGAALVVGLSLLRYLGITGGNVNFITGLTPVQYLYVFIAGAFAITAMILPGISGSTILLIFGVYIPALEAVKEVLKFRWSVQLILGLIVFGIGALAGIVGSIKGIKVCLEKFRKQMVWFILGMMGGSIYAIMAGPTTLDEPKAIMELSIGKANSISILGVIIGVVILVALETTKSIVEKKNAGK